MANQFGAVTGFRKKPNYVDIINAKTPYLGNLKVAGEEKDYREDMLDLEERRLSSADSRLSQDEAMALKALEMEEAQSKKANILGLENLGITYGMGRARNKALESLTNQDDTVAAPAAKKTAETAAGSTTTAGLDPKFFSKGGAGKLGNWTKSLGTATPWLAGAGGGYAGGQIGQWAGEKLGVGGRKERGAVGGAIGGGVAGYLASGGDPYTTVLSSILGGGAGWGSSGW